MELTVIVFELVVDPVTGIHQYSASQLCSVDSNQPVDVSSVFSGE
jgi:hypothetical protein